MAISSEKHPEKKRDEVFITNGTVDQIFKHVGWKTKRLGAIACDIHGKRIFSFSPSDIGSSFVPCFAKYEEVLKKGFVRKNDGSLEKNPEKAAEILPIWQNVMHNLADSRRARRASKLTCG